MGRPAVFLDRDGTIIEDRHYLASIHEIHWIEGAKEAIKDLCNAGFWIVVITNQSGVARGIFDETLVDEVHACLNQHLRSIGAEIHGFYYCPHHPEAGSPPYRMTCNCRKPRPGLVRQALQRFDIDLEGSYFVGDKIIDLEAGLNAGVTPILVLTGKGKDQLDLLEKDPRLKEAAKVFPSLRQAAQWIIREKEGREAN